MTFASDFPGINQNHYPRLVEFAPYFQRQRMPSDDRSKLLELLALYAYEYLPDGITLASGIRSNDYLDCRAALSRRQALAPLGRLVLEQLDRRVVAVGGLTMGADPIAISTAAAGDRVDWFSVRKEPKPHGKKKLIEGLSLASVTTVAVVDDVVTTGKSTVEAITKCRDSGMDVAQVVIVVDREEAGGMDRIREAAGMGVPVVALFSKSEVAAEWRARQTSRKTA